MFTPARRPRRAAGTPQAQSAQPTWDYAPAPETVKVNIARKYGDLIGGREVMGKGKAGFFLTINPADEKPLAEVSQASEAQVQAAVDAARKALPSWAALPGIERAKYIYRIARRIQERARELAVLETLASGKPIKESRDVDVPLAAAHFFYYAGWADKLAYAFPGRRVGPVGVCAQVIPWNFPLLMAAWKLARRCLRQHRGAQASRNNAAHSPPARRDSSGSWPPGGRGEHHHGRRPNERAGQPSGSRQSRLHGLHRGRQTHRERAQLRAGEDKSASRLNSGKSQHHLRRREPGPGRGGIISGIYFNQGEVCCAGSRLLVQERILDDVIALTTRMASLRVGDPLDKNTDIGAINSAAQRERVEHYTRLGVQEGATLHDVNRCVLPAKGFWCRPSFFTGVQPSHTIAREEIFGPVLSVMSFRTPEEAITRANNSPYGLAAGVWTDKGSKIFDTASKLRAGVVWCNTYNKFDPASPFGGYKESGFGREGGVHGLRPYVSI